MELTCQWTFLIFFIALVAAQDEIPMDQPNPCLEKKCKKPPGSMCVPMMKGDKLKPKCKCPTDCIDEPLSPVCSVYGKQYDNVCSLHLYACKKGRNIPMAYNDSCIASQDKCLKDELMQFPHRILDWLLHLKTIDEFGQLDPNNNVRKITDEEREKLARWKFELLDRKHDNGLDSRDLKEFRYALMPLEHCADDFFKMCDSDSNSLVTFEEWVDCLMVYERPELDPSETDIAETELNVIDPNDNEVPDEEQETENDSEEEQPEN